METTVIAAQKGNRWTPFTPEANLSEYPSEALRTWTFEHKGTTTGSMLGTAAKAVKILTDAGFQQNDLGGYDPGVYGIAYQQAFVDEHVTSVKASDGSTGVERVPQEIKSAFVFQNDPNRATTAAELAALKKTKKTESSPD